MLRPLFSLGLFVLGSVHALAVDVNPKLAPDLSAAMAAREDGRFDVLVYLTQQADLRAAQSLKGKEAKGRLVYDILRSTARTAQAPLIAALATQKLSFQAFYITNAVLVRDASAEQIADLAARQDVAQVYFDKPVLVIPPLTPAQRQAETGPKGAGDNIKFTKADKVWSDLHANGQGIVVAGNDTGIDWEHTGLRAHYRGVKEGGVVSHDYNWHDAVHARFAPGLTSNSCGNSTQAPCDDQGHGTHTIGTVVGDDGQGNQVGMAPGATFIGCRNMDAGVGKPSTYIECFEFFLAPYKFGAVAAKDGDPSMAPHVINNSWGCPSDEGCRGSEFLSVLNALKAAGIMVVAAAGNEGSGCSSIADAPAHHSDEVLVVGAVDHRSGTIASFSSRGPSAFDNKIGPDLSAPGVTVRSTIAGGGFSGSMWSGTSMASPHVAGAVALLWSYDRSLIGDIDATIAALTSTSTPKTSSQTCGGTPGSSIPNNTYGFGNMDVLRAAMTRHPSAAL